MYRTAIGFSRDAMGVAVQQGCGTHAALNDPLQVSKATSMYIVVVTPMAKDLQHPASAPPFDMARLPSIHKLEPSSESMRKS